MRKRDLSYVVVLLLAACAAYVAISGLIMDVRGVPTFILHVEAGYASIALGLAHLALNGPLVRSYARRWRRTRPGASNTATLRAPGLTLRRTFLIGALAAIAGVAVGFVLGRAGRRSTPGPETLAPDAPEEGEEVAMPQPSDVVSLPEPSSSPMSLDEAVTRRRSMRSYTGALLSREDLSALLRATQGVTDRRGLRAAPSAGALYPLETYVVVHRVDGLAPGLYRYQPDTHSIQRLREGDLASPLTLAGIGQSMLGRAGVALVFTAVYARIRSRYGARGDRYVLLEAGHAAQNTYLMATALGLGSCAVGAFDDGLLNRLLGVDGEAESALYMMAVGHI